MASNMAPRIPRPPLAGKGLLLTGVERQMMVVQREADCEYYERKIAELQLQEKYVGRGIDK